jgi:hypothetical protein
MNMRDYPTLHIDTNLSKGTVYSKKGYEYKSTWETIQHYIDTNLSKGTVYSKNGYGCKRTWENPRLQLDTN